MIDSMENVKKKLEEQFVAVYNTMRVSNFDGAADIAIIGAKVNIKKKFPNILEEQLEEWLLEIYELHVKEIILEAPSIISSERESMWEDDELIFSSYWPRYAKYLKKKKNWSDKTIGSIDKTTNEILKNIGNPNEKVDFDYRGLVLGYVQSGKTANFTGLINKAYDVGYKLVIVLAGMHNDLRSQTQLRLEKEVVGVIDKITGEASGVSEISKKVELVQTWTTVENDISITASDQRRNLEVPNLMVVKKNKNVLETLNKVIETCCKLSPDYKNIPVLIIDDEADQASVNTADCNEDPKTINSLIRQLLNHFNRKSYVGYTATPFANLLIDSKVMDEDVQEDLYPKDFIIALPKPEGYCGPEEYFNVTGYEENDKPLYIRHLDTEDLDLFKSIKNKEHTDLIKTVPSSMKKAIQSFVISIAIRNLRKQEKEHNSMLIHASHLTDIQLELKKVVELYFEEFSNTVRYSTDDAVINELQMLYIKDFIEVQKSFNDKNSDNQYDLFSWVDVYSEIKKILGSIDILAVNGESKDILDYDSRKQSGWNLIVIGGNKLSRGLTLDGLTVSYYYRGTSMYDSLLQMGRWFGFRDGYMDLCRIYTSQQIALNFEHLAEVMVEIRKEFDWLVKNIKLTPYDYAVSVLGHDYMDITSPKKMQTAEFLRYYGGKTVQTRIFESESNFYKSNMAATINLVNNISEFEEIPYNGKKRTKYHLAKDISAEHIIEFLSKYKTGSSSNIVDSKKISDYIQKQISIGNYLNFNIAVVDTTKGEFERGIVKEQIKKGFDLFPFPVKLGKVNVDSAILRSVKEDKSQQGSSYIDIGAIVSSKQNKIDLELSEIRDFSNPLLLIYPLHPNIPAFDKLSIKFSENLVPIGIAFDFPRVYKENLKGEIIEARQNYVRNKTVLKETNE